MAGIWGARERVAFKSTSVLRGPTMIPVPPNAPDVLPGPEPIGVGPRGGEPLPPLVLQAFDEIEELKRTLAELRKRFEALEHRVVALEPKA